MTPRERVLAAINHEEPNRVPLVIGVSNATGIKMTPYSSIKKLASINAPDHYLYDWPELGTAEIDEETMRRLLRRSPRVPRLRVPEHQLKLYRRWRPEPRL